MKPKNVVASRDLTEAGAKARGDRQGLETRHTAKDESADDRRLQIHQDHRLELLQSCAEDWRAYLPRSTVCSEFRTEAGAIRPRRAAGVNVGTARDIAQSSAIVHLTACIARPRAAGLDRTARSSD